jgi:membrane associated rhomboid family serine protease
MFIPLRDENPTVRWPCVTVLLIAANVAAFFFQVAAPQGLESSVVRFGAVPYDIVHFRAAGEAGGVPAAIVLGLWFLAQILNVGMGGGVAWFAHIGGFLAGILLLRLALGRGFGRRAWRES